MGLVEVSNQPGMTPGYGSHRRLFDQAKRGKTQQNENGHEA